jgi:hypothetical protein
VTYVVSRALTGMYRPVTVVLDGSYLDLLPPHGGPNETYEKPRVVSAQ